MRRIQAAPVGSVLLLLAIVLAAPAGLQAQTGTVTGAVRAADTGNPLVAAVVQVVGPDGGRVSSSLTNQSGRFQVSNVPPGTYTVLAATTGYATGRVENVTVSAGQSGVANFDLAPRAIDLDPVVVSASRRQERALDAPARVEVVTEQAIEVRPAITPVDHLRSVPGIDIATIGVQSTQVVARGFNNIFSGALYTLTDHRIAGVPSLRVNLMHFVPVTNEDLERMEIVLGPGSALYGPNTANGVLHMITRSPLSAQGTTLSITGGERGVFQGAFRTAHLLGENLGFKLSGQFLRADEWEFEDPVEAAERQKFQQDRAFWRQDLMRASGLTQAEADRRIDLVGNRDFDVLRWGGEARADWRIAPDLTGILSIGSMTSNGIELTGLGAGQAVDWRYTYYQARANWGRAFAQIYLNSSNAGDTYLLRNGAPITDRSNLLVGQIQNSTEILQGRQLFTYGADYLRTVPRTEGTISGFWEEDDETLEIGGYLQSETNINRKLDLVLAGRVDTHSALPDPVFSPRAAIVFKPVNNQTFRASFNRAFSTPTSLNQFLDLGSAIPVPDAARLGYSLRIQGTGDRGFTLRGPDGSLQFRSPFTPETLGGPVQLLSTAQARAIGWPAAVQVVAAGSAAAGAPLPAQMIQYLAGLSPASLELDYAAPGARGRLNTLDVQNIPAIRESTSNTFEVGYKGILGQRVLLSADVWWSRRMNLVTPLTIATPFLHFEQGTTQAYLTQALTQFFMGAGMPQQQAAATAAATATGLAPGFAAVPIGVLSSPDVNANGAQLLMTFYNVDESFDIYGSDISATAIVNDTWSVDATLSLVNQDRFTTTGGELVTLNAPKRKTTVAAIYRDQARGLNGEARLRHTAGYPVVSGVYRASQCVDPQPVAGAEPCVQAYSLLDVTLGYRVPRFTGASVQFTVQNLLDEDYRSFPGVPRTGRMALLRLRYDF
jgi:outer membrane receptor for ferrienterochelin and colicins